MEHLEAHGIACPQPVRDKSGAQWSMFKGRAAAILTFLNGISLRRPDAAHCQAAGAALAGLHAAGKGFGLVRPNALSVAGWHELAAATVTRADAVQAGLGALINESLAELEARWPRDLLAYDLAVLLGSWCFESDGAYNVTKGKAMIAGYRGGRAMADEEVAAMPLLMRGAALRFLLTRLFDWLNPDPNALVRPKDPREYSKKLRFHMQVKQASEYGF
jgi:homoserine kinase type II